MAEKISSLSNSVLLFKLQRENLLYAHKMLPVLSEIREYLEN